MLWQRLCLAPNVGVAIKQAMRYLHVCMPHKGAKAADSERGSRCGGGVSQGGGGLAKGKRTCLPPAKNSLSKLCNLPKSALFIHTPTHPHTQCGAPLPLLLTLRIPRNKNNNCQKQTWRLEPKCTRPVRVGPNPVLLLD